MNEPNLVAQEDALSACEYVWSSKIAELILQYVRASKGTSRTVRLRFVSRLFARTVWLYTLKHVWFARWSIGTDVESARYVPLIRNLCGVIPDNLGDLCRYDSLSRLECTFTYDEDVSGFPTSITWLQLTGFFNGNIDHLPPSLTHLTLRARVFHVIRPRFFFVVGKRVKVPSIHSPRKFWWLAMFMDSKKKSPYLIRVFFFNAFRLPHIRKSVFIVKISVDFILKYP